MTANSVCDRKESPVSITYVYISEKQHPNAVNVCKWQTTFTINVSNAYKLSNYRIL